jgi:glucokinase
MILAGDIGGTKCNLAVFEARQGKLHCIVQRRYASQDYAGVEEVVQEFISTTGSKITAAGFGVAGPVVENQVHVTNLPWVVDSAVLAQLLELDRVVFLNDLEATGYGLECLEPSELFVLNQGTPAPQANQALIAAGTGLGEAILFSRGGRRVVAATEGGHTDFAPRTEEEIELLRFLKRRHKQVSFEMVLSGQGFRAIHEFFEPGVRHPSFDAPDADPAAEISRLALAGSCAVCGKTLNLWAALYGAEAGNFALKSLARGGVYVAGGIAVKILEKLKDGRFVQAFCDKSKFRDLLAQIPIQVVLNENVPLLGAAARAAQLNL